MWPDFHKDYVENTLMFIVMLDTAGFCSSAVVYEYSNILFLFSEMSTVSGRDVYYLTHIILNVLFFLLCQIFNFHEHTLLKKVFQKFDPVNILYTFLISQDIHLKHHHHPMHVIPAECGLCIKAGFQKVKKKLGAHLPRFTPIPLHCALGSQAQERNAMASPHLKTTLLSLSLV